LLIIAAAKKQVAALWVSYSIRGSFPQLAGEMEQRREPKGVPSANTEKAEFTIPGGIFEPVDRAALQGRQRGKKKALIRE